MEREETLYYYFHSDQYTQTQNLNIDKFCNGLTVKNAGTTLLIFDLETILPGESKTIGGNRRDNQQQGQSDEQGSQIFFHRANSLTYK